MTTIDSDQQEPGRPESARERALEAENARLRQTVAMLTENAGDAPAAHGAAALDADAEHFRTMADNIPQLAWMADKTGWIFWYNKRWYDYTGTVLEDMKGWGWKAVHHPDHIDRVVEIFSGAIERGEPWEDTFPLRSASGEFRWFLSRAMPIRDETGEVVRWFGTNTDITEQLDAESALREAEEQQRMAAEAAGIGAWDFRPLTGELRWDRRTRELMGAAPDAEITLDTFVSHLHPDDRERMEQSVMNAVAPDGDTEFYDEFRTFEPGTEDQRWIASRGRVNRENGQAVRFIGTVLDITERKTAEHQQQLLINELNHRVKNTLATVQALAARTLRSAATPEQARTALTGRLLALSKAHDILTAESWEGAEMETVARSALAPFMEQAGDRFTVSGPFVRISPKKAVALSMALNELATNAAKYGALSSDSGKVEVKWEALNTGDARRLRLTWTESGGPEVTAPDRAGFGTRLIQQGLAGQLNAEVEVDYRPEGLRCVIDAPLLHVDRKTPR